MATFFQNFNKVGGLQVVKEYARNGVLLYACMQILLTGFKKKSLELLRNGVTLKIKQKLRKKYKDTLDDFDKNYEARASKPSRYVWVCWMQGMDKAPALVQRCYQSIQENLSDREVVLLTDNNIREYAKLPDYIWEKYDKGIITRTHLSDLLRVELLCEYGGTWIDATVFCSGGCIPSYMLDSELFMFQNLKPGLDGAATYISSWFMTAWSNQKILLLTRELLWRYWEKKNRLIGYFLLHQFVSIAIDRYPEEWEKVVQFPNSTPHILQLMLFDSYDDRKWQAVTKQCPFHKLSYKFEEELLQKDNTFYQKAISLNYLPPQKNT